MDTGIWIVLAVIVVWYGLNKWLLPRFGVET